MHVMIETNLAADDGRHLRWRGILALRGALGQLLSDLKWIVGTNDLMPSVRQLLRAGSLDTALSGIKRNQKLRSSRRAAAASTAVCLRRLLNNSLAR